MTFRLSSAGQSRFRNIIAVLVFTVLLLLSLIFVSLIMFLLGWLIKMFSCSDLVTSTCCLKFSIFFLHYVLVIFFNFGLV
jgi:hypothetical protein